MSAYSISGGMPSFNKNANSINQYMQNQENRPLTMNKRNSQNYQRYMDKMSEALNKNIE